MRRALLVFLVAIAASGCPPTGRSPEEKKADEPAPVGTGTLTVLVVDEKDRPIADAVVWAPGTTNEAPVPQEPVVLEQRGLEYRPRFLVARKGQRLRITNEDPEVHNVHSNDSCCAMNVAVAPGKELAEPRILAQAGEATFLCDIHAHMRCSLIVLDSVFGRTDADGRTTLVLPLGKRKLRARALDRERVDLEVDVASVGSTRIILPPPARGALIVPPERLPWPSLAAHLREGLEEALRLARAGKAEEARAAAEEAEGTWFAPALYGAIRETDKAQAEDLKSDLRKLYKLTGDPDALAKGVADVSERVLKVAYALPKR